MVESGLSEITSEPVRNFLIKAVENKLKTKSYKINVASASQAGEGNFIGVVYRVSFSAVGGVENGRAPISKLILKVAPTSLARREQFFSRPCFLRENYMYNEVLPFLRQFEQSKGVISEEHGFTEYPKYYGGVDDELNECVLLEDLSVRNYNIIDRQTEETTADHVHLVMKTLAKFHAISFALKDQQPEKFRTFAPKLSEIFIRTQDPFMKEYFRKQGETVIELLSAEEDAHLLNKVKKLFEKNAMEVAADCLDLEKIGDGVVISHADTWQNNTMFKRDNNGKPIAINLVDWQLSRVTSPIIDIVYFMFACTTKELRDAHYDDFLNTYHKSLSAHIKRLGSDPDELFPYKTMLEHFRKFGKFGLVLAAVLLPVITQEKGTAVNLDDLSTDIKNGAELDASLFMTDSSAKKCNKRLRDVVIDMDRLGYI